MNGIRLLHLGPEDHDILLRVEPGLFDAPLEPAQVFMFLSQGSHEMVLAMHQGHAVGMASGVAVLHPDKHTQFFINEIGVRDDFQRQGIGAAMVERLRGIAADRGCGEVWVVTTGDNDPARGMYRKTGGHETPDVVMYEWAEDVGW